MTLTQISKRVQDEADARLGEVVERLLFLLERPPFCPAPLGLVWKWKQTGLLDGVDDCLAQSLAAKLEEAAMQTIDWIALENPDGAAIDKAADRFFEIRKEAIADYEANKDLYKWMVVEEKRAVEDPYLERYHRHGFS